MASKTNYEKNGVKYYRATYYLGRDSSGKRVTKEFYGKSKKDAETKKEEYRRSIEMGLNLNHDKVVFGELMHEWIYSVMLNSNLATSTKERYEGIYRNYLSNSPLQYHKVKVISYKLIQNYFDDLKDLGKSESTIKNVHKLLKIVLGFAHDEGYVLKNSAKSKHISIATNKSTRKEIQVFTDGEISIMRDNLKNHYLEPIVLLALGSGLRKGEILGLKWSDIDFAKKLLNVERTLRTNKYISRDGTYYYKLETQQPKSKSSIRIVSLPVSIVDMLEHHKKKQEKLMLKGLEYDDFVFVTESGKPIDGRNLLRSLKRFLCECNLTERSFHTLRHTYC